MIGRLRRVDPREIWRNQSLEFARWLMDNTDLLSDVIGITIAGMELDRSAGSASACLAARDQFGSTIIVDVQLGESDHDNLGKLLTYAAGSNARTAVWMVSDPRPDHVKTLDWLNESSPIEFYLVKVEAVQIDNSPCAPLFSLVAGRRGSAPRIVESRPEQRLEARPEPRPEPKVEPRVEPRYEPQPEPRYEPRPEPVYEAVQEPRYERKRDLIEPGPGPRRESRDDSDERESLREQFWRQ